MTQKTLDHFKLDDIISEHIDEVRGIIKATNPQPVFEDYGDFQILIVRKMDFSQKNLKFLSEIFVHAGEKAYQYNKESKNFSLLKDGNYSVFKSIESFYINNLQLINIYIGEVEKLEDSLYDRSPPAYFMDLWFDLKKDLAKTENYYYRSSLVFREFIKKSTKFISPYVDEFNDIEDSIRFQTSNINTLEDRLESLHHYYESIKNEKLNSTLLLLTLISGVFLPLNLIVGFFGMNTPGLFFSTHKEGTMQVVWLLLGVVVFCLAGMKILRVINDYFFKFFLGKNQLYNRLYEKIEAIDNKLSGK